MFKISPSEKRSLLEALIIVFGALALIMVYQIANEPLYLARQNHISGLIVCGVAALGVFIARMQL